MVSETPRRSDSLGTRAASLLMAPLWLFIRLDRALAWPAIGLIAVYRRFVSPALPAACRYHPSCSCYSRGCYERFGFLRGTWLTMRRVGRCHPYAAFGEDPVPSRFTLWGRPRRPQSGDRPVPVVLGSKELS